MLIRMDYRSSQTLFEQLKNVPIIKLSSQPYQPNLAEVKSDEEFISQLKLSRRFGGALLGKMKSYNLRPNNFYTQRTSKAFHDLLSNLIEKFLQALKDLQGMQSATRKEAHFTIDAIISKIEAVEEVGTILTMMIRGAAIKKHFRSIESHLSNPLLAPPAPGESDEEEVEFVGCQTTDSDVPNISGYWS